MGKNRVIPFGYMMQNGEIQPEPAESNAVQDIFNMYLNDSSLSEIAGYMSRSGVSYNGVSLNWNKNMVKRIIENEKYIGADGYPHIVDEDIFKKANMQKKNKSTSFCDTSDDIKEIRSYVCCKECGGKLYRTNGEIWDCGNPECSRLGYILTDNMLFGIIINVLNTVISNIDMLNTDGEISAYAPNIAVTRQQNEINRLMDDQNIDFDKAKEEIFRLAEIKYDCCTYEWLQIKYDCELEKLSFRNIIGRYFRIYGKENLNEKKPIQYFEKETAKSSILALLKLFDKYKSLKPYEEQIDKLNTDRSILVNAAKNNFIPNVNNKNLFNQNEKKIMELSSQLEKIKQEIITTSIDLEAMVSNEILTLKRQKSQLNIILETYKSRLLRTQNNLNNKPVKISEELKQFIDYFPDFNVDQVNKVENFHENISKSLKKELKAVENELKIKIEETSNSIAEIDKSIEQKLSIQNAPKLAIDKVIDLAAQIKQLNDENGYYKKKKQIEENISTATKDLNELKEKALDDICNVINDKMLEINQKIYIDKRQPPKFNITGNKYTFKTSGAGDTGTGTAFANLISFDLSLLELTKLPALAHDLPLLKNIENVALENIIYIYSKSKKQIFIAIDKLNSYDKKAIDIINKNKVLQLSKDRLLFVKNWKSNI